MKTQAALLRARKVARDLGEKHDAAPQFVDALSVEMAYTVLSASGVLARLLGRPLVTVHPSINTVVLVPA